MVSNTSGEVQGRAVAGRYRLGETLGRGGMGRVWRAYDEMLDRHVAVKEIRIDGLGAEEVSVQRERSLREARATARIDHPNVVRVYDVIEEGERLWIVMQLVEARSLQRAIDQDGPFEHRAAARIGLALLRALRAVHARGVLHRDIKPSNVLIDAHGKVVLTDFGIAAIQDTAALTMTGALIGSPDYMAPERISGGIPEAPSDLWSLGATLYAAVEGRSPFSRTGTLATLHAVLYEEPELPVSTGPLLPVLAGLLRKDPQQRLTLDEVDEQLRPLTEPPARPHPVPAPAPPPTRPVPVPPPGPRLPAPPRDPEEPVDRRSRPRHRRRKVLLSAMSVVAAVAVAATTVLVLRGAADGTEAGGGASSPPSASPEASPEGARDEEGFRWSPPADWTRTPAGPAAEVHYLSPDGTIDLSAVAEPRSGDALLDQWTSHEADLRSGVAGYRKIRLETTRFQERDAVIWEYTFTDKGVPYRGRQLGFYAGETSYQINIWYPSASETSGLRVHDRIKKSFEPRSPG
ncbi:serine/threonine-protein kinase [Streptomyces gobiensis]|uniref:serine/threonine-protein kinase n=1 Tax=Streptomyces gobiensis TaxID=2875706 RepID=UPI001E2C3FEC|nr:serine/threonine-protein kinase [Streptomyces gobiensis]UGY91417.1 serine/threonine protein kinase [Streptomyces gobiensis]